MTASNDPWGGVGPGGWDPHPTPTPTPPAPDPHQNQGQGQGQVEGQGQGQLEGQLQGQGELQGQGQSQSSSSDSDNWNGNGNGNGNLNGNANFDANGNLNGNANFDANANGNLNGNANLNDDINHNVNVNANLTDVQVSVCVDATVGDAPSAPVIDMHGLDLGGNNGIFFQMPDFGTQTLNGDGSIFHLDQVNNLVNNGNLSDIYGGGLDACGSGYGGDGGSGMSDYCCDPCAPPSSGAAGGSGAFNFSQNANAYGATATSGDLSGNHSPLSGGVSAANSITQEAFTQHIVLGSNIQYNSMPITVVGGDSFTDTGMATGGAHSHS